MRPWADRGRKVLSRRQLRTIQYGILTCVGLLVRPAAGQRFKYNLPRRAPDEVQLRHTVTDEAGAQRTYIYNRYAEFGPCAGNSVFGVALGPGNDAGFNLAEPRVPRRPERVGALVVEATTADKSKVGAMCLSRKN